MSSIFTALGLRPSSPSGTVPSRIPHYLAFNFFLAYMILASRGMKKQLGLDHNLHPREDLARYGEDAVRCGKITREQLDKLKRNEAAHANSMEHFSVLAAALLTAKQAGVSNYLINRAALVYSCARVGYGVAYIYATTRAQSLIRSAFWYVGLASCMQLLWVAA
jgi:uncharacterized MAPEG superfamily protein